MKTNRMNKALVATLLCLGFATQSFAATNYILTVTNASNMPLSPAVAYVINGQLGKSTVGTMPSDAFVKLCQTGNRTDRVNELKMNRQVTAVTETSSMLMPGESRSIEIQVQDPSKQSLHFESMYGKTKDACAVADINSHNLYALSSHVTSEYITKDNVLLSGAFLDPLLSNTQSYACANEASAVDCLRTLATANMGKQKIRFFAGYLPGVLNFLESKYGYEDTNTLLLPTSGAVQFRLKLKH